MNLDDCLQKRLIRQERPDREKALISIKISEKKLDKAKESYEYSIFDAAVILAYTSMFHAARAVLFRDGFVEKSHKCVVLYLYEKYAKAGKLEQKYVNILDEMRAERHETIYGLDFEASASDADIAIRQAEEFLKRIKEMLK